MEVAMFEIFSLQNLFLRILQTIPLLLISLPVHEFAHAFTAYKFGDYTAKRDGRLTLNPLAHLDPLGVLCFFFVGFGFAKPVPTNPFLYRKRRKGIFWVALAGPLSNLALAFIGGALLKLYVVILASANVQMSVFGAPMIIYLVIEWFVMSNVFLFLFNLIPIPPLDGHHILYLFLPDRLVQRIIPYEQIFGFVLIALFLLGNLGSGLNIVAQPIISFIHRLFNI